MPLVGLPGLEPGTSSLSVTRSNQLSYNPEFYLRNRGIVPKNAPIGAFLLENWVVQIKRQGF